MRFYFFASPQKNADLTQKKHTLGIGWFWQYSDRNQASCQCSPTCQVGFQDLLVSCRLMHSTPGRLPCWIPGTMLMGIASSQSLPLLHQKSPAKMTDLRAAVLRKPSSLSLLSGSLGMLVNGWHTKYYLKVFSDDFWNCEVLFTFGVNWVFLVPVWNWAWNKM